ncbi:MAG: 30S ribosome-binding factor RbfA [Ktedonobacterales bacterium]
MAKKWRQDQLGEVINRELSDLIHTRLKDPRVGFASITDVEVSQDIRHAKVFVSVMGPQEEQRATLAALEHANGFLRRELAQRLTVRHTPELVFRLDTSIERGTHVLHLINQVSAEPHSTSRVEPAETAQPTEPPGEAR